MATIVHLSDLHFLSTEMTGVPPEAVDHQTLLFDSLVHTLNAEFHDREVAADLLVLTGDVFDTAATEPTQLVEKFCARFKRIRDACAARASLILPGNHDRRDEGVFHPFHAELFECLERALRGTAIVVGQGAPFLATLIPDTVHRLPADVVAYDSTYLPSGWASAGGILRQEDLLQVADRLAEPKDARPLLVFTHHHLVPTPVTDLSLINVDKKSFYKRYFVRSVLPRLVANADYEELTMTALGAGTFLSVLHALGRAVLVAHGHKHYPTARVLRGTVADHGDVAVVSAGSAGLEEPGRARLWPSFNIIRMEGDHVEVEAVVFSPRAARDGEARFPRVHRQLLAVDRAGVAWNVSQVPEAARGPGPRLLLNEARYRLVAPDRAVSDRWDLEGERLIEPAPGWLAELEKEGYAEIVEGIPGSTIVLLDGEDHPHEIVKVKEGTHIRLPLGSLLRYRLQGGICRTLEEARRHYDPDTAFEWVGLVERYGSRRTRLVFEVPSFVERPFASSTDLATGIERPLRVERSGQQIVAEREDCPPRTLLRIYWPLERREG
ncbi:MAG TPA: metallophosphoesterase [Polyangia bacterium]|nr:metallophosphoesterase [Polyangia bacterium]